MNINNNVSGKCSLKCNYSFNYSLMNLTGQNKKSYLLFKPNNIQNYDQVIYNNNKYNVTEIRIYNKSLHKFGGKQIFSELQVIHKTLNGKTLNVHIPVKIANGNNITILDQLISFVSDNSPSCNGNGCQLNLSTFTLNDLVPRKKYLVYSLSDNEEVIVFKQSDGIYISKDGNDKLKLLIEEHKYEDINKDNDINIIASEQSAQIMGEDNDNNILYDCFTVDYDEEEKYLTSPKEKETTTLYSTNKNVEVIIKIIIFIFCFVIFIYLLISLAKFYKSRNLPNLNKSINNEQY